MRSRIGVGVATGVACAIVATGCGGSTKRPAAPRVARPRSTTARSVSTTSVETTTTAAVATTTTQRTVPTPTAAVVTTTPATQPPPPVTSPPTPAPLVTHIARLGAAGQVVAVATDGYGTGTATVTAYERGTNGWKQVFGPWFAYIGRNGVAPEGTKREGDGRTPSGVFGFDFMFGVNPDPGVHFPFRRITGTNIVWDDDSTSANYNEWIDTNRASAGANPEPMYRTPSYSYGVVIAYNASRTPGLGSAIFLHVSHGSSTAGCVSLPADRLLALMQWLDPARSPRIAIGTLAHLSS